MHKILKLSILSLIIVPFVSCSMDRSRMKLAIYNATKSMINADILNDGQARKRNHLDPNQLFYLSLENQDDINPHSTTLLNIYTNPDTHTYDAQWEFPSERLIYITLAQKNQHFIVKPMPDLDINKKIKKFIIKKNEIKTVKN